MKAKSVVWFEDPDKLKILKSKPKAKRPNFAKLPVAHFGGKMFFSLKRNKPFACTRGHPTTGSRQVSSSSPKALRTSS